MAHALSSSPQSRAGIVTIAPKMHVCMHVLGKARTDVRVLREASALVESDIAVSIIDIEDQRDRPRQEELRGIRLKHLRSPSWFIPVRFKPWFLVKGFQILCRGTFAVVRTPADAYHAQDLTALPACYIAAKLRRKPLVFDAHELPLVEPNVMRWRRLHALATRVLKMLVPGCTEVITVSPPIVRELQRRYGGPAPVLIRNIPDYHPPVHSDRLRQRLGLGPQSRIALFQGYLDEARGLERLVYAAKFLDPNIVIVMMGRKMMRMDLEGLIVGEGVADRVKILPPVPYEELLEWTASADIGLIIYSRNYSLNVQMCLPNKLFEYLMAGLPVLASSLDAIGEIIETYQVGSVAPSLEPAEIGRAINTLLAGSSALARMRANALAASQQDLRWDVESKYLVTLYRGIFEGDKQDKQAT